MAHACVVGGAGSPPLPEAYTRPAPGHHLALTAVTVVRGSRGREECGRSMRQAQGCIVANWKSCLCSASRFLSSRSFMNDLQSDPPAPQAALVQVSRGFHVARSRGQFLVITSVVLSAVLDVVGHFLLPETVLSPSIRTPRRLVFLLRLSHHCLLSLTSEHQCAHAKSLDGLLGWLCLLPWWSHL